MSIDLIIFLISSFVLAGFAYYIVRQYIKVYNYEQQVNRGWNDLIDRAERMIAELKEINYKQNQKTKKKK